MKTNLKSIILVLRNLFCLGSLGSILFEGLFQNEAQIIGPSSTINIISPVLSFSVMMETFFCIYFAVGKQKQGLQLLRPQHKDKHFRNVGKQRRKRRALLHLLPFFVFFPGAGYVSKPAAVSRQTAHQNE